MSLDWRWPARRGFGLLTDVNVARLRSYRLDRLRILPARDSREFECGRFGPRASNLLRRQQRAGRSSSSVVHRVRSTPSQAANLRRSRTLSIRPGAIVSDASTRDRRPSASPGSPAAGTPSHLKATRSRRSLRGGRQFTQLSSRRTHLRPRRQMSAGAGLIGHVAARGRGAVPLYLAA
jgi:hypothetical protein